MDRKAAFRFAYCTITLAILTLSVGCGAIFKGSSQNISVMCSPDTKFIIQPDGMEQTTPTTLDLARNKSYVLSFQKDGYETKKVEIKKSASVGIIVLDVILTGLVGVVVDAATGSWYNLTPDQVMVALSKTSTSSLPSEPDNITVTIETESEEGVNVTSSEPGVTVTVTEK